jgi:hypothetical protein
LPESRHFQAGRTLSLSGGVQNTTGRDLEPERNERRCRVIGVVVSM